MLHGSTMTTLYRRIFDENTRISQRFTSPCLPVQPPGSALCVIFSSSMAPFTEKGSCRDLVFLCKLPPDEMCEPCAVHEAMADRTLRKLCEAGKEKKEGVCLRLHASDRDRRRQAREEPRQEPRKRSRSAPPQPTTLKEAIKAGRKRKKGRKTMDKEGFENSLERSKRS